MTVCTAYVPIKNMFRMQMYEKIKRVKAFDRVWENMAKYAAAGVQDKHVNKGYVILKYIIIPGVNDNLSELKKFAQKAKEAAMLSAGKGVILTEEEAEMAKKEYGNLFAYLFSYFGG